MNYTLIAILILALALVMASLSGCSMQPQDPDVPKALQELTTIQAKLQKDVAWLATLNTEIEEAKKLNNAHIIRVVADDIRKQGKEKKTDFLKECQAGYLGVETLPFPAPRKPTDFYKKAK